ncbi:MAG: hypothetical protein RJA76_1106 [Bacteroidota bacterium]|jgi:hypothetical protein
MSKFVKIVVFGIMLSGLSVSETKAQCAMCRTTLESTVSDGRNNIATGINTGILYLLVAPYLIVGVVGFLWWKNSKVKTF